MDMRTSVTRRFYNENVHVSTQKTQYIEKNLIKTQYIEMCFMLQEKYFNIHKWEVGDVKQY